MTSAHMASESTLESTFSRRLRRVLEFPLTNLILGVVFVVAARELPDALFGALGTSRWSRSAAGVGASLFVILAVCAAYCGYVRLVERRPALELGIKGAAAEGGAGFLIGALAFTTTALLLRLAGACTFADGEGWRALGFAFVTALSTAFFEEFLVRGVLFRVIEKSLGSWIALALSAAIFGLLHGANPGASLQSTAAIALEAGILLAAAFLFTRRLWMPIGLHAAWNFTEGGVFGASISGADPHGFLTSQFSGNELLTGGEFGPEASAIAVAVCLVAATALLLLARRKGHLVAPFWRRSTSASDVAAAPDAG